MDIYADIEVGLPGAANIVVYSIDNNGAPESPKEADSIYLRKAREYIGSNSQSETNKA